MPRYKLTLEYDGTPFVGWQRQRCGGSVEQALEQALCAFTGEEIRVQGSGRTDAGVHAMGQVAHTDLPQDYSCFTVQEALNHFLKKTALAVINVEHVADDFHARFSATSRSYTYRILCRRAPSALYQNRIWHIKFPLDAIVMNEAAQMLVGDHDFTSFRDSRCQAKSPFKSLTSIQVTQPQADHIRMDITAPSFLHHQVRNIMGTLKDVGQGRISPEDFRRILQAKDRKQAGITAPAHGLYLVRVDYD